MYMLCRLIKKWSLHKVTALTINLAVDEQFQTLVSLTSFAVGTCKSESSEYLCRTFVLTRAPLANQLGTWKLFFFHLGITIAIGEISWRKLALLLCIYIILFVVAIIKCWEDLSCFCTGHWTNIKYVCRYSHG